MNTPPPPPKWGELLRYTTDDRDITQHQLCIMQGGNGDWYVSIAESPDHYPTNAIRLCTSGGASHACPGLGRAIADAYRALYNQAQPIQPNSDPSTPEPCAFPLWKHLHDEHGLTLTESELHKIIRHAAPYAKTPPELTSPITDEWLKSCGFKWHQHDRQPNKHWLLWLGDATPDRLVSYEDIGIELAPNREDQWFCWLRSDTAGRYHRFIHIRQLKTRQEVIDLVQSITRQPWNPDNHLYGSVRTPEQASRIRQDEQRFDHQIRMQCPKWSEIEKDDTRGRALPDHMEEARIFETQPKP